MLFDVEIVLREKNEAVTERLLHTGHDAPAWDEMDVEAVLKAILLAIDRVRNPGTDLRHVVLRGFSWIAEPTPAGVVIAVEIPMGAAVAGPFDIAQPRLNALIDAVVRAARLDHPTVH